MLFLLVGDDIVPNCNFYITIFLVANFFSFLNPIKSYQYQSRILIVCEVKAMFYAIVQ